MQEKIVIKPFLDVFNAQGKLTTQLIYGELVKLTGDENEFGVGIKSELDGYTGFCDDNYLIEAKQQTHKVKVINSPIFENSDLKSKHICNLSLNSFLYIKEKGEVFSNIGIGWIYNKHISEINEYYNFTNMMELAIDFSSTPYVWAGRTSYGIDCSAFVQMLFLACGIIMPRDTKDQCKLNWQEIKLTDLKTSDLIFWDGHVGIMLDNINIIHANASDMMVKQDLLKNVIENIKNKENKDIKKILRYKPDRQIIIK